MKIRTSDLTGRPLDWAAGLAFNPAPEWGPWSPSTNPAQAETIIKREEIALWSDEEGGFFASANDGAGEDRHGATPLIAAMRCYVASHFGDEIEVPDELTQE